MTKAVAETETETLTKTYVLKQTLRYGEVVIRKLLLSRCLPVPYSIASAKQIHGKELSYNNIKDADAALRIAEEFTEPTAVALKAHESLWNQEVEKRLLKLSRSLRSRPSVDFGGIIVLNRPVDVATAEQRSGFFLRSSLHLHLKKLARNLNEEKNLRLLVVRKSSQTARSCRPGLIGARTR